VCLYLIKILTYDTVIDPVKQTQGGVRVMVFIATFNNISAISWQLVLLVDETRENK
jgi:hypothetical protein